MVKIQREKVVNLFNRVNSAERELIQRRMDHETTAARERGARVQAALAATVLTPLLDPDATTATLDKRFSSETVADTIQVTIEILRKIENAKPDKDC